CLPRMYKFNELSYEPPVAKMSSEKSIQSKIYSRNSIAQNIMSDIKGGRIKTSFLLSYHHNPVYSNPDVRLSARVLANEKLIPFHVAVDSYLNETAVYADIFLPASTYLESWDIFSSPSYTMIPYITLMQPIVKPLGQSLPFYEICSELANRIGGGMEKHFPFSRIENYIQKLISNIEHLKSAGGLDYLKDNGVWYEKAALPRYKKYEKEGFNTPSGKIEIYSRELEAAGFPPLPFFQAISKHQQLKEDEFILITFQNNLQNQNTTPNSMWLAEISHDNPVWINKRVAKRMGIEWGDIIEVSSPIGRIKTRAHVTNGINPKCIAICDGHGHWAYGRIARAELFRSRDPNTKLIWWARTGNGSHQNYLIPISSDPIGGGQAWMDTKVKIRKI
ncbi:MAG: molybdopterin dinucleotide binding domain-containing protein, partial [Fidelibacterota bacterium]